MNVLSVQYPRGNDNVFGCLLIDAYTEESDINALLTASDSYMHERAIATDIIDNVRETIKD